MQALNIHISEGSPDFQDVKENQFPSFRVRHCKPQAHLQLKLAHCSSGTDKNVVMAQMTRKVETGRHPRDVTARQATWPTLCKLIFPESVSCVKLNGLCRYWS
jgi:hypothetical protein